MRRRNQVLLVGMVACGVGLGCATGTQPDATSGGTSTESGGGGQGGEGAQGGAGGGVVSSSSSSSSGSGGGSESSCSQAGETRPCYGGDAPLAGIGACTLGTETCEASGEFNYWGECQGWGSPSAETCDGVDNDCNGVTDEGCCVPALEVCDGVDNDCNGVTDEGCCVPAAEICDGVDNDCDGQVDNGAGCGPTSCAGGPAPCAAVPIPPKAPLGSTCKQLFPKSATLPCPIPNPGKQYYVSAKGGSDANDGLSPSTPWATLCHAVAAAALGSTLQVAEGDYASAQVYVGKELVVKGGYDSAFADWNPDTHATMFYGALTLDHNAALWGGFRMISGPLAADSWSYMRHRIAAGALVRNYVEIVVTSGVDSSLNLYGIVASACAGGASVLRCNDIYVRSSDPEGFVTDAIEYGNLALHNGKSVLDSNRICLDKNNGFGNATSAVAGYGTCGPANAPASVLMKNNVIENVNGGGSGVHFYGCSGADLDLVLTNNTILSSGSGVAGYEGPPSTLRWRLTNNILFSLSGGGTAVDVGSGAVQILSAEGNLTFGYGNNGISPMPLLSAGNELGGGASATSVFMNAAAGAFQLKAGGQGIGKGVNVYDLPVYGAVTTDIQQAPRPMAGPWDRGAYQP